MTLSHKGTPFGTQSDAQPPIVSTTFTLVLAGGYADGLVTSTFQGFDPPLTGSLTLGLGRGAYALPGSDPAAAPLAHVVAGSPVVDPVLVADIAFATPANAFEDPTTGDIALAANTQGYSSLALPLEAGIANTVLGKELAPLISLSGVLLPGFNNNNGVPRGGSYSAAPVFKLNAGLSLSQTVTVLGIPAITHEQGSLEVGRGTGQELGATLADTAATLGSAGQILADAESGNLVGAALAGVATLSNATTLIGSVTPLLAAAAAQHNPTLPPVANPVLSLDIAAQAGQTFSLGVGTPTQVTENVGITITADKFGDYALGKLLGQVVPQVIADLSGGGTTTAFDAISQLAQDAGQLAQLAASRFGGIGNAGAVPSGHGADISIGITVGVSETQNTALGSLSNGQTFTTTLQSNAQGFYDLGVAAQPLLVDLLVAALQTNIGHEALQIGGDVLTYLDSLFGGGAQHAAAPPAATGSPAQPYDPLASVAGGGMGHAPVHFGVL